MTETHILKDKTVNLAHLYMAHLQSRCQEPNVCLCEHLTSNLFVLNLIDLGNRDKISKFSQNIS